MIAAAKTGAVIQFKKPQFLSAIEMNNDAKTDTLKLERVKTLPNEKDSSLLPESMNTEEDTSGVV